MIAEAVMRLPRLTTRRLMVLVAVAAVGMGAIEGVRRRRVSFLHQAARHRKLNYETQMMAYLSPKVKSYQRFGAYHAEMSAKYERAARYPWLPVPPDPPPPE